MEEIPLDPVSYSLAKKHKKRHESGGADQIDGWIAPSHIGPRYDVEAYTYFRTRNIADTSNLNHHFAPSTDTFGTLGYGSLRWNEGWLYYSHINNLRLRGGNTHYLPWDSATHVTLQPYSDGYSYIGSSTYRFAEVHAVTVVSGDLGFEERRCMVCGKPFKPNDSIVLKVREVGEKQILVVPVHAECNPHSLNPVQLKRHENQVLKPRSNSSFIEELPPPYQKKARNMKQGEFEVIAEAVEDDEIKTVTVLFWDGFTVSFSLKVDATDEELIETAIKYRESMLRRALEEHNKKQRGIKRLNKQLGKRLNLKV